MAQVEITTRSHNLGIGWTNQATQTRGGLAVAAVTTPSVIGTPKQVLAEYDSAQRGNSGNDWRVAFFVDGVRVLGVAGMTDEWQAATRGVVDALRLLRAGDTLDLDVE